MAIDRRKLFALGGLGAISVGTGEHGPEFDVALAGAVTVKLGRRYGEWCVLVPDWNYKWHVGAAAPPVTWMKLSEFLAVLDSDVA